MSSISDAYLQFITASFSVYLLPTLSRLSAKTDITREIVKSLKFVLPAVAAASLTVWLLRDFAIWLLFSDRFTAMRDLFAAAGGRRFKSRRLRLWLSGDRQSVAAFYILTEISQFTLLTAFSHWLIPAHGAVGAAQAYMATYIVYFALCSGVFYSGVNGHDSTDTCTGIRYPAS